MPRKSSRVKKEVVEYDDDYGVVEILEKRGSGRNVEYKVRWEDSWEPASNLTCDKLIKAFEGQNSPSPKARGRSANGSSRRRAEEPEEEEEAEDDAAENGAGDSGNEDDDELADVEAPKSRGRPSGPASARKAKAAAAKPGPKSKTKRRRRY